MNIGYVFKNISGSRRAMDMVESALESPDTILYNDQSFGK